MKKLSIIIIINSIYNIYNCGGGRRSGKEVRCDGVKLEKYFGNIQENLSGFHR